MPGVIDLQQGPILRQPKYISIVFTCEHNLLNIRIAVKVRDAVTAVAECGATTEEEDDDE